MAVNIAVLEGRKAYETWRDAPLVPFNGLVYLLYGYLAGHLVANILIFMNVHDQSRIMNELIQEGHVITKERAACLSPYRKDNINRFGAYFLVELREN